MAYLSERQLAEMPFGHLGRNVRISDKASLYEVEKMSIGDNSRVDDFCVLSGRITIGRNVSIAVQCNVAGGSEGVTMEDFSTLAYGCQVFSQSDDYSGRSMTNPTVPAKYKKELKQSVTIGRRVIVGASSVVFPGVTLAEGTSVGAMSLVNRSTEPWGIYAGVPARRIGDRSKALLELERQYLADEGRAPA